MEPSTPSKRGWNVAGQIRSPRERERILETDRRKREAERAPLEHVFSHPEEIRSVEIKYEHLTLNTDTLKNIDIPWSAFKVRSPTGEHHVQPLRRIGFNTSGKEIELLTNAYPITKFPTKPVYQYEINVIHSGVMEDHKRVIRKCWNSDIRQMKFPDAIWDGHKLAWTLTNYPNFNEVVFVKGGLTRPTQTHGDAWQDPEFKMSLIQRRKINLGVISGWLQGRHDMDEHVLEALNFLDHLLRAWPSGEFAAIKRAFYFEKIKDRETEGEFYQPLCNMGASVYRGIYQAIRPSLRGLVLNVDTAHCVFFSRTSLMGLMQNLYEMRDKQELMAKLAPKPDGYGGQKESEWFVKLNKKIQGLRVMPNYEGCPFKDRGFRIKHMINGYPRQYMVDIRDRATGAVQRMSIETYFLKKYNVFLKYPDMPLMQMEREDCVYPAEFLVVKGLQRYPFKLVEAQTAQMIKFCATRPNERLQHIRKCKDMLQHDHDPTLKSYGMEIGTNMLKTKARLLPNPEIQFGGNQKHNPGTSGRWDLRGKRFYQGNAHPLKSWGVGFFVGHRNSINHDQTLRFLDQFMKIYKQHGGQIANRPHVVELSEDIGNAVKKLYDQTGDRFKLEPQLLVVIVPNKDSFVYLRIKKSCDCRFGVPSQVLQAGHCVNNRPQYHSNVLMKVNAKLGGITARAIPRSAATTLRPQSMIIGADVTHPTLGVWTPSLAAMSVSADPHAIRYMGGCECNGDRVELISNENIEFILEPLVREWVSTVGQGRGPKHVYYFRDGVSESEFTQVLDREVPAIKFLIAKVSKTILFEGKICVVIANKRHHIRAFPNPNDRNSADKNGNPLPGTLIDRDVCSPHDWDFFLYAHIALQGTSRPVHYHVLLDEIGHKPHELENMIYEHSYQYIRSTTSVSIHPAVYYAHLISTRARHHEDVPASSGPQSGPTIKMSNPPPKQRQAIPKLLPIEGSGNRLAVKMWYI